MSDRLLLPNILFSSAQRSPNRVAISHGPVIVTYRHMAERVVRLADVLSDRGLRRGDRIAWWGDLHVDTTALYYAAANLGAIFVPINPRFNAQEAQDILDVAEPNFVVTDGDHSGDVELETLMGQRSTGSKRAAPVSEEDPDSIFFTSGTTGAPKGVVLTHRSNWLRTMSGMQASPVSMSMFPLFHWAGWSYVHAAWYRGGEYVLEDGGNTTALLEAIQRRKVTNFYAIPAVWRRVLDTPLEEYDLSSLRQADTGTSSTPPDFLEEIARSFPGTTTRIGYGATEAGVICVLEPEDLANKPNSVGLPVPGMFVKLVDDELWVQSAQASMGYYKQPELTAEVMVDGWYRTGDRSTIDADGFVSIVGRFKEQIRTGGEFVAPAELDEVIRRHPAVADAAVAGVPSVEWGEVVAAFVVLRDGGSLELPDLQAHCAQSLANFKLPRALHVVSEIPRTGSTGKVQRRQLVSLAAELEGSL